MYRQFEVCRVIAGEAVCGRMSNGGGPPMLVLMFDPQLKVVVQGGEVRGMAYLWGKYL